MVRIVADFHVLPRQAGSTKAGLAGKEEWWDQDTQQVQILEDFCMRSGLWTVLPSYYMCSHYLAR